MQNIREITKQAATNLTNSEEKKLTNLSTELQQTSTLATHSEVKQKALRTILKTFKSSYPHIFGSQFFGDEELSNWGKLWGRVTDNLSEEQIRKALKKSVFTSKFPPSPAQFREYALDILPAEQAWTAIGQNEWATEAYERLDSWFKKNSSEKEVKQAFIAKYSNLVEKCLLGDN
jgi:hypothetical protein